MSFVEMLNIQAVNETKSNRYKTYFRAKQTPRNTSVVAPPELRTLYFTSVSYCRLGCQVINERIDLDSITAVGKDTDAANEFLAKVLKVNGGADMVASAHLQAMEYGRAYIVPTGSTRDDGIPILSVVPGRDMVHRINAYTGEIIEALQVFGMFRNSYVYWEPGQMTTYLPKPEDPMATVVFPEDGFGESDHPGYYSKTVPVEGPIPVFPLMCRGEPGNTFGRPEAKDVFLLQDSACRYATDMSIASALMGTPKEFLLGAEQSDFGEHDAQGKPVPDTVPSKEDLYMSRFITISDPAVKLAQASAAQLQNFTTALNNSDRRAASTMGVPVSTFGVASDANPQSGDAQQEDDKRLIRRSEQLIRGFEPGWIELGEYLLSQYGFGTQEVVVRWMDPSLPNLAGRVDAVQKLSTITASDGKPLYTWQELRRKLGESDEEIKAAEADRELMTVQQILTQPSPTENQNQGAQNEPGPGTQSGG